ncbi:MULTISPECIES: cytochrome o ubiquinol oxidase subunit IV [unclassified Sphingomonas]|uniref:cytochrome o ubiquinol oxidase subunit IV n=1 Tax=unclassified Sphingomonas TaxID=196159 RepID=UPI00092ACF62|nr:MULTISPECIES: cytochrome o ubiquinol oxidase subunit IV [unclassified Sphingomonas]MBN8849213.1 cytochrome o ubiquinol oxidase subunit IV [Sphingomonas sp.]MBS0283398.1 cytochrome o ubiquinol oxidase subunit IV [Pseudomonadota bacterium]OJV29428.1 MAG: cytochrome o ubiquinol oxidase subunit IV [Sphingomonas sp. 67-36]
MSAQEHHHHDAGGAPHGTRRGYLTGFLLSVLLTAVPFALVMSGVIADQRITAAIVAGLAAVQIVVHMIYFLHMNTRSENGWSLMALIFTLVILVIVLAGTLWVMINMNHYMMPPMIEQPAAHTMDMSGM